MKILIPVENKTMEEPVCPSFGRTPYYMLYNTDNEQTEFLENKAANSPGGAGIQAAQMLVDSGADVLITLRCGENAAKVLKAGSIAIYKAEDISVGENIKKFREEKLALLSEIHAGFHNHGGTPS
jgi:predicted Fe-Mo cluster-binding NifX family protein